MAELTTVERFRHGLSIHTSRCLDLLAAGKPGDTITREAMSAHIGVECDPQSRGYAYVQSAIRRAEREKGVVWRWSRADAAYRCLDDTGKVGETSRCMTFGARKINRGLRVAATVDPTALDDDTRREHSLNIALAGAMRILGHGGTRKKLASGDFAEPDTQKVLALMRK